MKFAKVSLGVCTVLVAALSPAHGSTLISNFTYIENGHAWFVYNDFIPENMPPIGHDTTLDYPPIPPTRYDVRFDFSVPISNAQWSSGVYFYENIHSLLPDGSGTYYTGGIDFFLKLPDCTPGYDCTPAAISGNSAFFTAIDAPTHEPGEYEYVTWLRRSQFWAEIDPADIGGSFDLSIFASTVPEPATWAMLLLGFSAIGIALRRSRQLSTYR